MPIPLQGLWASIAGWLPPMGRRAGSDDPGDFAVLRGVLDNAPAAIVSQAKDGSIVTWNSAAERLFGWKMTEVAGQLLPFVDPGARTAEAAQRQRVLTGNELFRRRGRFRHRDGEELELLVSSTPQRDAKGSIVGVVSVFEEASGTARTPSIPAASVAPPSPGSVAPVARDIPVSAPAAGAANLGFDQPSQFLARVSHDLRQPLHALSLLTGALERRVKEPDARELVENAGTMVRALQDTFDNVVDLSRLEEGQVLPRLATARADEALSTLAADFARNATKRGIAFRYVACGAPIEVDAVLLQRALRQLLGNALRFAERADGRTAKILLGARRHGDRLRIIVADNGIGVPPDRAAAIFDPFVQLDAGRASGGLGLGLVIARRLARLLATDIAMRSVPGKGSQFWIDVKLAQPAEQPVAR